MSTTAPAERDDIDHDIDHEIDPGRALASNAAWRDAAQWVMLAIPIALVIVAGWNKRSLVDDGFINFRVVDQIFAGHGAVFNAGERVEAYTSPLWLGILVVLRMLFGWAADVSTLSIFAGVALMAAAFGFIEAGALRLIDSIRRRRTIDGGEVPKRSSVVVPIGALVIASFPPLWHYATTGLDSALFLAWIGLSFWMLTRATLVDDERISTERGPWLAAVVVGSGWLVRPDAFIFSIAFLAVLVLLRADGWKARLRVALVGLAPSIGYELLRMGYYANLLPNTALAKEAGQSWWENGFTYLSETTAPYHLWPVIIGLLVLVAMQLVPLSGLGRSGEHRAESGRRRVLLVALAPMLAGLLHALWVLRVGGDYFHARFFLPSLFALAVPAAAIPIPLTLARTTKESNLARAALIAPLVLTIGLAGWSVQQLANDGAWRSDEVGSPLWGALSSNPNPTSVGDYPLFAAIGSDLSARQARGDDLYIQTTALNPRTVPMAKGTGVVAYSGGIGVIGRTAGSDVWILDANGLADPVAARLSDKAGFLAGHQKVLPFEVGQARFAAGPGEPSPDVEAARRGFRCGRVAELLHAVDDPMSPGLFVQNVFRAPGFTTMRVPSDAHALERQYCT